METPASTQSQAEQFYSLSEHWKSDLEFFKVETAFFHRLIDDHFAELISAEYLEKLKVEGKKLYDLERDESELNKMLSKHMKELTMIIEGTNPEYPSEYREQHSVIEKKFNKLTMEYRELKSELFALVEKAMGKKKLINKL